MTSSEKHPSVSSYHEEPLVCFSKSTRSILAKCLVWGIFLGLLSTGTILLKTSKFCGISHPSSVTSLPKDSPSSVAHSREEQCIQVDPLLPKHNPQEIDEMDQNFISDDYYSVSAGFLARAIPFQTISFDNMSDPDLPLNHSSYANFELFIKDYIFAEFPNVNRTLTLERINNFGLLYTWKGTDHSLKPTVLMAHYDVVPVEEVTRSAWKCDPWNGTVKDGKVWGRGSVDTKHTLVAVLEAVEALAKASFKPKRTLILSFGFDEEIGGSKGATYLAKAISKEYSDGAAVVIDEGSGQVEQWGTELAVVGSGEKGWMAVNTEIRTPGGHASLPPAHTSIGMMSQIVDQIEQVPYYTYLSQHHPLLSFLTCGLEHAPDFPDVLKPLLEDRLAGNTSTIENDTLALEFIDNSGPLVNQSRWVLTTAKSVNVIEGGTKENSLPERVLAKTDVRIHIAENTSLIKETFSAIVSKVAEKNGLRFIDFDSQDEATEKCIKIWTDRLSEPASISPTNIVSGKDTVWSIFAGTSKNVLGSNIVLSPGMSAGNTDSRLYANISEYIYRFSAGQALADSAGMHTVNEAMDIQRHINGVRWFSQFIRNMDEADFDS